MKKVLALTAGVLVALAPTGTAFAGEVPGGNAYGNCKHSSSGANVHGELTLDAAPAQGNGGMVELGKGEGGCADGVKTANGPKGGGGKPPVYDPSAPST